MSLKTDYPDTNFSPPWHGFGDSLPYEAATDIWVGHARMEWTIATSPVKYVADSDDLSAQVSYDKAQVLYRNDTRAPLAVVPAKQPIVQPRQALEIFRSIAELQDYALDSAGWLEGGARFWALARKGEAFALPGGEEIEGYQLLSTSCDALATTVTPISIHTTNCSTLPISPIETRLLIPHARAFDRRYVREQAIKLSEDWDAHFNFLRMLAVSKVSMHHATIFLRASLTGHPEFNTARNIQPNAHALRQVRKLLNAIGIDANTTSSRDTVWGLVNAISEFVDHGQKFRLQQERLSYAWFGKGTQIKRAALSYALSFADDEAELPPMDQTLGMPPA